MPQLILTADEMHLLLAQLSVAVADDSPLANLPSVTATNPADVLHVADKLAGDGVLVREHNTTRVNLPLAAALLVIVEPDEVIDLTVTAEGTQTGFTVCRRNESYVQCNLSAEGTATIAFPVRRELILETIALALSGERPLPEPTGVWFACQPAAAFVLGTLVRTFGDRPHELADAKTAVRDALNDPTAVLPFLLSVGQQNALRLRDDPAAFFVEVRELIRKGLLTQTGTKLTLNAGVVELLGAPVVAGATLQRVDVRRSVVTSLHILRLGERLVLMCPQRLASGEVLQHWEEVDRDTLRQAAVSLLLNSDELATISPFS